MFTGTAEAHYSTQAIAHLRFSCFSLTGNVHAYATLYIQLILLQILFVFNKMLTKKKNKIKMMITNFKLLDEQKITKKKFVTRLILR